MHPPRSVGGGCVTACAALRRAGFLLEFSAGRRKEPGSFSLAAVRGGDDRSLHLRHSSGTEENFMKVFVTGGTGYIGSAVALRLKKAGHDVLALVRSKEKGAALQAAGVKLVTGELGNPASYAAGAYGSAAVVHCAMEQSANAVE